VRSGREDIRIDGSPARQTKTTDRGASGLMDFDWSRVGPPSGCGVEIADRDSRWRIVVLKPSVMWEEMAGVGGAGVACCAAFRFLFLEELPLEGLRCSLRYCPIGSSSWQSRSTMSASSWLDSTGLVLGQHSAQQCHTSCEDQPFCSCVGGCSAVYDLFVLVHQVR
jgi:hypothetical protein